LDLGKCLKQAATTDKAKTLIGAIGGAHAAKGKVLREAAKEEGLDSCPLADACDKVAEQHPAP
jgi:hypothetical protein